VVSLNLAHPVYMHCQHTAASRAMTDTDEVKLRQLYCLLYKQSTTAVYHQCCNISHDC